MKKRAWKNLTVKERALLFMVDGDLRAGRDCALGDWHGEFRETLFTASSAFVHFSDQVFFNVVRWDELKEYGVRTEEEAEHDIVIPPGHLALAGCTPSRRTVFQRCLVKMHEDKKMFLFVAGLRAHEALGGRAHPFLQAWAHHNRDKPKDIVAASLSRKGFEEARALLESYDGALPWMAHRELVRNSELAKQWRVEQARRE